MGTLFHWLLLFLFWLILSGIFDLKHVGIGLIATLAVAVQARRLQMVGDNSERGIVRHLGTLPWFSIAGYSFWLLRQIVYANFQIARVVLDPRLPIQPAIVHVPTRVRSDAGITLLANSITATPGTITVRSADDANRVFVIHALVNADDVAATVYEMEERIIRAMGPLEPIG